MLNLLENRNEKIKKAISIEENFGFILYQTGVLNELSEIKMRNFNNYIETLNESKSPKAGDFITWEENQFLGKLVKYAGIVFDEKNLLILHKDHGEIFLDDINTITQNYGTKYTQIKFYKNL